tara:strand:- start:239 stop:463 length:225 start_codon:yes stop_codon:yes gene_type:complete
MTTQPEALRLAEWIEGDMTCQGDAEIAAELRRLHESNTDLLAALKEILDGEGKSFRVLCEQARAAINKAEGEAK